MKWTWRALLFGLFFFMPLLAAIAQEREEPVIVSMYDREIFREAEEKLANDELTRTPRAVVVAAQRATLDEKLRQLGENTVLPTPPYLEKIFQTLTRDLPGSFRFVYVRGRGTGIIGAYMDGTVVLSEVNVGYAASEAEIAGLFGHEIVHIREEHSRDRGPLWEYLLQRGVSWDVVAYLMENAYDKDNFQRHIQIRADRGAINMLMEWGYDACALRSYLEHKGFTDDNIYLLQHKLLLEEVRCGGDLFKIGTEEEFKQFKAALR